MGRYRRRGSTDDVDNIEGGQGAGDEAHCMGSASLARDPTFVDGTLIMAGNFTVDAQRDTIAFVQVSSGNEWYETTRSNNASFGWKCPNYVAYFSDDNEEKIISENGKNLSQYCTCCCSR